MKSWPIAFPDKINRLNLSLSEPHPSSPSPIPQNIVAIGNECNDFSRETLLQNNFEDSIKNLECSPEAKEYKSAISHILNARLENVPLSFKGFVDSFQKAYRGDDKAMVFLAKGYMLGTWTGFFNLEVAKQWLEKAVEKGNSKAENILRQCQQYAENLKNIENFRELEDDEFDQLTDEEQMQYFMAKRSLLKPFFTISEDFQQIKAKAAELVLRNKAYTNKQRVDVFSKAPFSQELKSEYGFQLLQESFDIDVWNQINPKTEEENQLKFSYMIQACAHLRHAYRSLIPILEKVQDISLKNKLILGLSRDKDILQKVERYMQLSKRFDMQQFVEVYQNFIGNVEVKSFIEKYKELPRKEDIQSSIEEYLGLLKEADIEKLP